MAGADPAVIEKIFTQHLEAAQQFLKDAQGNIDSGFKLFQDAAAFKYDPYEWEIASPPIIGYNPQYTRPQKPGSPQLDKAPALVKFPDAGSLKPPSGKPAAFGGKAPIPHYPNQPGPSPSDPTGAAPQPTPLHYPNQPVLLPLPPYALPYPYLTIPPAPVITMPLFDGTKPDPIHSVSLQEYLDMLSNAYAKYSQDIPNMARANWMLWFNTYLDERPLIDKLANVISLYIDTGGAGIPVPIEEAIVTRATDRVAAEQRRATLGVYDAAVKRGLTLPSGVLVAGLKEARQASAEAVSKIVTDVAIKNLELEHDHMKFMLQLGSELEKWVAGFASETAKLVLEANAQAIEMTKLILTGMIEINNTIVKIYLAQWEGYKAAVEVFKARIEALDMQVKLYEAQIRAELAKVEVNKAVVEVLNAVANTNRAIADVYKTMVDAESSKIEADRVRVMIFEAQVHAYVARVEAWKAQWQGYTAAIEGETAKVKAFEAEVQAYTALVGAYKADVEAYGIEVHGQTELIQGVAITNKTNLESWSTQMELLLKQYVEGTDAYKAEWGAVGEYLKGYAEGSRIIADSLFKGYEIEMRIDTEKARESLAQWSAQVQTTLQAAAGLVQSSSAATALASSALNGITSFAGEMATVEALAGAAG